MAVNFSKPKKLYLLDQDGTLYTGLRLFPETKEFLNKIKQSGASYVFVTNNASKTKHEYVAKLAKLGINADESEFYTSAEATISYLKTHHAHDYVYLVATKALIKHFKDEGIKVTQNIKRAKVAVLTYDTSLDYKKITKLTTLLRRPEVVYLATNPDLVCPTEEGYLPDCGSFALMFKNATGRVPHYLGKPNAQFALEILKKYNVNKEEVVMIGDRLYTDIALGHNAGIDTVLVLSGEATSDDVFTSPFVPTFVVKNIGEIL